MSDSTLTLRRRVVMGAILALATIAAIACSNQSSSVPLADRNSLRAPGSGYTYYNPIDYPNEHPNRITGIANDKEIVGVYGDGTTTLYSSYTAKFHTPSPSQSPYPTFVTDNYPDGPNGTYLTSIVQPKPNLAKYFKAGYVVDPNGHKGNLPGDWGVTDNEGLWSLIQNHPRAGMQCHNTQLFGIDAEYNAVGFSWLAVSSGKCTAGKSSTYTQVATEVQAGGNFSDYTNAPGSFPVASGIYETGTSSNAITWVVGSENNSGTGTGEGWYKVGSAPIEPVPYPTSPAAVNSQFNGLNSNGEVVGTYEDTNSHWHGFTVSGLLSGSPSWSKPIDLGASTNTVVTGVDSSGDICGWYYGNDSKIHGFVGIHN